MRGTGTPRRRPSSIEAEAAFRARVAELGGTIVGTYVKTKVPLAVQCAKGHVNDVWPSAVLQGSGICLPCRYEGWKVGPAAEFRVRVEKLGGTVLGEYVNASTPVLVRCKAGHERTAKPLQLTGGNGFCAICTGQDSAIAGAAFLARMAAMGATVLGTYAGAHTPVPARCAAGHGVLARPHDVRKGIGICTKCAGQDPATAEAAFRARLAELGATPIEPRWLGSMRPHRAICANGHECRPYPANLQQRQGVCRKCTGKEWDTFYTVTSAEVVKFGISSGEGHRRLALHRSHGYRTTIRLLTGLPGDTAEDLEDAVRATLRLAGLKPVQGREYFDISALAVILDVVDNYPDVTEAAGNDERRNVA